MGSLGSHAVTHGPAALRAAAPIGSKAVPFCGLCLGSYKVAPKKELLWSLWVENLLQPWEIDSQRVAAGSPESGVSFHPAQAQRYSREVVQEFSVLLGRCGFASWSLHCGLGFGVLLFQRFQSKLLADEEGGLHGSRVLGHTILLERETYLTLGQTLSLKCCIAFNITSTPNLTVKLGSP